MKEIDIGKRLKEYRLALHMTQPELAEKAGIDEKHYGKIERNKSQLKVDTMDKLCKGLNTSMAEFFLPHSKLFKGDFLSGVKIRKMMCNALKADADIHYNRQIILHNCEKCIWYDGYIGSAYFDEYEFRLMAEGNKRGTLYLNHEEILSFNGTEFPRELQKYIPDDETLEHVIFQGDNDESILRETKGTVLFLSEANWLTLQLFNQNEQAFLYEPLVLDTDNIYGPFSDCEKLVHYLWDL